MRTDLVKDFVDKDSVQDWSSVLGDLEKKTNLPQRTDIRQILIIFRLFLTNELMGFWLNWFLFKFVNFNTKLEISYSFNLNETEKWLNIGAYLLQVSIMNFWRYMELKVAPEIKNLWQAFLLNALLHHFSISLGR